MNTDARPILFFDGVCGLCSGVVRWLYRKDKNKIWAFAPLQGEKAQLLLGKVEQSSLDTLIVVTPEGSHLVRGAAIRYIVGTLPGWRVASLIFRWLPLLLLNLMYRVVARSRYSIFGKVEYCERVPMNDRERFHS